MLLVIVKLSTDCIQADNIPFTDAMSHLSSPKAVQTARQKESDTGEKKKTDEGEQNTYSCFWKWTFPTKHWDGLAVQ